MLHQTTSLGSSGSSGPYTSRLQKGAGLVPEMRRLCLEWRDEPGIVDELVEHNVLSLPSRGRVRDVVRRTFIPRFVRSDPPDLWRSVAILERSGWSLEALLPIHYYAASAAEPLLWDFVVLYLAPQYANGTVEVGTEDAVRFINSAPPRSFGDGMWSDTTTRKVARGLLAALRDFGVLEGANVKRISPLRLPTPTFAFLSRLRAALGYTGPDSLADPCWRLFYLPTSAVERFYLEAHQQGLLRYEAAGSLVRIEYPKDDLVTYADYLAQRAH